MDVLKVMLIGEVAAECEVLETLFRQRGDLVNRTTPNFSNYLKSVQFAPDLILVEMPDTYHDQLRFIQLLGSNRKTSQALVFAYGNHEGRLNRERIKSAGAHRYFRRPVRFSRLLSDLQDAAPHLEVANFQMSPTARIAFEVEGAEAAPKHVDSPALPAPRMSSPANEEALEAILAIWKDPQSPPLRRLGVVAEQVTQLFAFPFTVTRILQAVDNENTGAAELGKIICADAALTAALLRAANSVAYASRGRRVQDVKEAIVRLGFDETRKLALGLPVLQVFQKPGMEQGMDRQDFWYQSLGRAILAEKLAANAGHPTPALVFVAGLLQEFGLLLMEELFPSLLLPLYRYRDKNGVSLVEAQAAVWKFTHLDLLIQLLEKWNIPKPLIQMLAALPSEEEPARKKVGESEAVTAIKVADLLVHALCLGHATEGSVRPIPDEWYGILKAPRGWSNDFFARLLQALKQFAGYFHLDPVELPIQVFDARERPSLMVLDLGTSVNDPVKLFLHGQRFPCRDREHPMELKGRLDALIVLNGKGFNGKTLIAELEQCQGTSSKTGFPKSIPILVYNQPDSRPIELPGFPVCNRSRDTDVGQLVRDLSKSSLKSLGRG